MVSMVIREWKGKKKEDLKKVRLHQVTLARQFLYDDKSPTQCIWFNTGCWQAPFPFRHNIYFTAERVILATARKRASCRMWLKEFDSLTIV